MKTKRQPYNGDARKLWENIQSRKLTNQILWDVILNCRKIRVKQSELISDILRENGCGFVNHFHLCPTIAIAIFLCEKFGSQIEPGPLETEFLIYIHSIWGVDENPLTQKVWGLKRVLRDTIKYGVKYLLSEAESQWMNFLQMSQNKS